MLIEETTTISFIEVCQKYHIPEELFIEMIEQGLFPDQPSDPEKIALGQKNCVALNPPFDYIEI